MKSGKKLTLVTINNYFGAAFRKVTEGTNWDNIKRRQIRCPSCPNPRLFDTTAGTRIRMILSPDEEPKLNDFFVKCTLCSREVCIRIIH